MDCMLIPSASAEPQDNEDDFNIDDSSAPLLPRSPHPAFERTVYPAYQQRTETYKRTFLLEYWKEFELQPSEPSLSKRVFDFMTLRYRERAEPGSKMVLHLIKNGNTLLRAFNTRIDGNTDEHCLMSRDVAEMLWGKRAFKHCKPYPLCSTANGIAHAVASVTLRWYCDSDQGIMEPLYHFHDKFETSTFHIMERHNSDYDLILSRTEIKRLRLEETRFPLSAANLRTSRHPTVDMRIARQEELVAETERRQEQYDMSRDEQHKKDKTEFAQSRAHLYASSYATLYDNHVSDEAYRSEYARQLVSGKALFEQQYAQNRISSEAVRETYTRKHAHKAALEYAKQQGVTGFDQTYKAVFDLQLPRWKTYFDQTQAPT